MVEWAIRTKNDKVLDPSVGDGLFLKEAAQRLRSLGGTAAGCLYGSDINIDAVRVSNEALRTDGRTIRTNNLFNCDFFDLPSPGYPGAKVPPVDAIIGNPPYIRYQLFSAQSRAKALRRVTAAGARVTRLSSAWAPFVIHSTMFLKEGGRLAFVLPEEFIHTSYAAEVRSFLRKNFSSVSVMQFGEHIFPGSQERVVLLLAEGRGLSPAGELRLARINTPEDIRSLDSAFATAEIFKPKLEPEKWEAQFSDPAAKIVSSLEAAGHLVPLRKIGKAGIGYVSGANDYFVLPLSETEWRGFPSAALLPTVISARQIPGAVFSKKDWMELRSNNEPCLLWDGSASNKSAVKQYIEEGVERGIATGYKCSRRSPWFVVPGVVTPHAIMTYMSDVIPRLALNDARTTCSNNLLAINLDGIPSETRPAFVAAFYNSATMLSAEMCGRRYGGGVLKHEPSEADRLLVPSLAILKKFTNARDTLFQIDKTLRERRIGDALNLMDTLLLKRLVGLNDKQVAQIQRSRQRRHELRSATNSTSFAKENSSGPSLTQ